jgi:hypothetical protein
LKCDYRCHHEGLFLRLFFTNITKPLLLLVENYVKDKITKEYQTFISQTYATYHNNKYHSGITYQQVQHAHFGSKSSSIVVSYEKN